MFWVPELDELQSDCGIFPMFPGLCILCILRLDVLHSGPGI